MSDAFEEIKAGLQEAIGVTTAQTLLTLIEKVDPTDTRMLDEIDAWVHIYLGDTVRTAKFTISSAYEVWFKNGGWEDPIRFTRSRDALKAIRPEGWIFAVHWRETSKGLYPTGHGSRKDGIADVQSTKKLPTEELAELHAIIQAIEYGRTKT